jgi:hypothetical protein
VCSKTTTAESRLSNQRNPFISATREATAALHSQPADLVLASGTHGLRVASGAAGQLGSCISPDIRQTTCSAQMLPPLSPVLLPPFQWPFVSGPRYRAVISLRYIS